MKLSLRNATPLLSLRLCTPTQAQTRTCTAPDGKVAYSDVVCPDQRSSKRGVEIRGNTLKGASLRECAQKDKAPAVQGESKEQGRAALEDGKFCQLAVGNTVRCP